MNQILDMMSPIYLKKYYWIKYESNLYFLPKHAQIHLNGLELTHLIKYHLKLTIFYYLLNQTTKTIKKNAKQSYPNNPMFRSIVTFHRLKLKRISHKNVIRKRALFELWTCFFYLNLQIYNATMMLC